jgi:hypothetical protein
MFNICLKGEIPTTLNEKGMASLSLFSCELKFGYGKLKKAVFPKFVGVRGVGCFRSDSRLLLGW